MTLTANRMRLAALTKALLVDWANTKDSWRDAQAMNFERTYLTELESSVDRALGVVEELDQLINKLRSDCE